MWKDQHRFVISQAFKLKVVSEIERGELTLAEARRLYDIRGATTIQRWLRRLGKEHLLARVIRVEMKGEQDRIKELEKRNRLLERALADERLKVMALESVMEIVEEEYGVDFKKKSATKPSVAPLKKPVRGTSK